MNKPNLAAKPHSTLGDAADERELPARHSLADVLHQSTRVSELVEECSSELAEVNAGMQSELRDPELRKGSRVALKKNKAVEEKVACVADKIAAVNSELSGHVRDRFLLKHELASVMKSEAEARHMALHDALTGLPNRALLDDRLAHSLAMSTRHRWGLAVMFLDLDGFKLINDTHGHATGDHVLMTVAQRLLENTRGDDTASRYGGDEFVYLMMDVKSEVDVAHFAEKLLTSLQAPCEVTVGSSTVRLSIRASIGIAIAPQHGHAADGLMQLADAAMYQAKQSGSGYALAI